MKLTDKPHISINWSVIGRWHEGTPRKEGVHLVNLFVEESYPHRDAYHWIWLYLWCGVRSSWFTSPEARRGDVANIGGHYQTFRDGVKEAAKEFAKFRDLNELHEEDLILEEYAALVEFAKIDNPTGDSPSLPPSEPLPTPEPPPPTQPRPPVEPLPPIDPRKPVPVEPEPAPVPPTGGNPEPVQPKPIPVEPPKDKSPVSWKKRLSWVGFVSSVALNVWFLFGSFIPPPFNGIVKMLLEALKAFFNS